MPASMSFSPDRPPCVHRAPHRVLHRGGADGCRAGPGPSARPAARGRRWQRWDVTWRLLGIAMPLTIAGVALLGWWAMGLAPAAALLLGAVLAPTDPVLASDVQVGGPTTLAEGEDDEIDEQRRGALRAHLRGRAQRRPGVPVRLRRDLPRQHRRGGRVGPALGGLGARRQGRDRCRGRDRGRLAAREVRVPGPLRVAAAGRDRGAAARARRGPPVVRRRARSRSGYGFLAVFACAHDAAARRARAPTTTRTCTRSSSGSSGC